MSLRAAAAAIERLEAINVGSWVDAHDIITADQAGAICACSSATIRRRASELTAAGRPIGLSIGGTWLLSRARVIADIEQREGLYVANEARSRCEKVLGLHTRVQETNAGERLRSA